MDRSAEASAGPVIVALGYGHSGIDLVRTGSALARDSGARLECLTIDTGREASAEEGEELARTLRFARGLGAVVSSAPDIDVASGLLAYAKANGAQALVLGQSRGALFKKGVAAGISAARPPFSIVTIRKAEVAERRARKISLHGESAGQYVAAILVVAAVTGLNLALAGYAGYWAAAITYLAAISLSALALDRWPVLLAALLSAIAWDFLFIPPRYTMYISRPEDILMLGLYLLVAVCSGWLTGRLRASERLLSARESRLSRLSGLASRLAGASTLGIILDCGIEAIKDAFTVEAIVILREGDGLRHQAESGWEPLDANARDAANASFAGLKGAGRFTGIHPKSEWHFVPMEGPDGCLGVFGLRPGHDASWSEEHESFLRTMVLTISSAVARAL